MNLAKWKYSQILKEQGGPIARVSVREIDFFGTPSFEAYSYLDLEKVPYKETINCIYGHSHGSGTSSKRELAIYKAISEALERWAWFHCVSENNSWQSFSDLRFDASSSTEGFAAYPGFFARSPREIAFSEALERWAVSSWWERRLKHRISVQYDSSICSLEIDQPFCTHSVAILWRDWTFGRTYGFACGDNFTFAYQKALVELDRNSRVLKEYFSKGKRGSEIDNLNEKRILFFAGGSGIAKFEQRIASEVVGHFEAPQLIVDLPVIGPWTKYTHVWRCLFDSSNLDPSRRNENAIDYFCF
jgi:hypothetical protein